MSRTAQVVLLCEDRQHEVFARRFLKKIGWETRRLRVQLSPPGQGSAEQFVRKRFPHELGAYRSNRHRVAKALIVMIDGDAKGVSGRLRDLDDACHSEDIVPRTEHERVAVFVPTSNIETWLAYLAGESVDETRKDYARLGRERECQRHVDVLCAMCAQGSLRKPAPPSLVAACKEYRSRLDRQ